jgi:hypothetical protein
MSLGPNDFKVVIAAVIGGFAGGILAVIYHLPPLVISILIVTGVVSLVYGFLGGIEGASLTVGALKLGGTMAALVGFTMLFNNELLRQLPPLPITSSDLVGSWKWVYGRGAWDGYLTFVKDPNGQITFTGYEDQYKDENSKERIFQISNGKATLRKDGSHLDMQFDIEDLRWKTKYQLKTSEPIVLVPAFRGDLQPTDARIPGPWGMMIYKRPPGAE